jgi:hypothetical protein
VYNLVNNKIIRVVAASISNYKADIFNFINKVLGALVYLELKLFYLSVDNLKNANILYIVLLL